MSTIQTLLISILITCVTIGATFLYFRNRIQRTEQKIDLMFNLIQEHENTTKLRQQFQPVQHVQSQKNINSSEEHFTEDNNNDNELINISDDDIEYDSDDSEEVSDTDEDALIIDNENKELLESHIKTISLSLEGAETSSKEIKLNEINNLEEYAVMTDDSQNDDEQDGKQDDEQDDDLDNINLSDEDVENIEVTKVAETNTPQNTILEETSSDKAVTDYSKLNKKELVEIANEKGMNTRGLRKSALVELLSGLE